MNFGGGYKINVKMEQKAIMHTDWGYRWWVRLYRLGDIYTDCEYYSLEGANQLSLVMLCKATIKQHEKYRVIHVGDPVMLKLH